MFTDPTTPNLTDYQAFLTGVVGIAAQNLPFSAGVATDGTTTTLTDAAQVWGMNQWVGYWAYDSTQGSQTPIISNTTTTLTLSPALAVPVAVGDAYLVLSSITVASFTMAMDLVNTDLSAAPGMIYPLAVYNLAADRLLNFAPDVQNQTFFKDVRAQFRMTDISVGVSSSVNDQGTSVGILNPESMQGFTLLDLQTLKTPYGRAYMAFAQSYGGALWGLS